jgi:hypothetical protein
MNFSKKTLKRIKIITYISILLIIAGIAFFAYRETQIQYCFRHLYQEKFALEESEFSPITVNVTPRDIGLRTNYVPVAESEHLIMWLDASVYDGMEITTQGSMGIAIYDKRNGEIWYSTPPMWQGYGRGNVFERAYMRSQFRLEYYDEKKKLHRQISFTEAIEKVQYELRTIPNGVRVIYFTGNKEQAVDRIPIWMSLERFEERIMQSDILTQQEKSALRNRYSNTRRADGFRYLPDTIQNNRITTEELLGYFIKIGYTEEERLADNAEGEEAYGQPLPERPRFWITTYVDFYLRDGDKFVVEVDPDNIEEFQMQVFTLEMFRYFGAATENETGYLFVPSGSGALIEMNNGKSGFGTFSQQLFGGDRLGDYKIRSQQIEPARLPVFGMIKENGAFLAYIERGAEIATISAEVSGGLRHSYNLIYPTFQLREKDEFVIATTGRSDPLDVVPKRKYGDLIRIVYCIMPEEKADYVSMANYYRDLLVEADILPSENSQKNPDPPFYVDIFGGAETQRVVLGVSRDVIVPLTTFNQAGEIAQRLNDGGINNIQMRMIGWFNRGINHDVVNNVRLIGSVGTRNEMNALARKVEGFGGNFYPDVKLMTAPLIFGNNGRGYNVPNDAARWVIGMAAITTIEVNRSMMWMGNIYHNALSFINSPTVIPRYVDNYIKNNKLDIDAISLRDMAEFLSSDMNSKYDMDRVMSSSVIQGELKKISDNFTNIIAVGGNQFALRHLDHVVGAPVTASEFYIFDKIIPFYEIVIHGLIDYAGHPINNADVDMRFYELKMAEYNIAPYFIFTHEGVQPLQFSAYNIFYSTDFEVWIEDAIAIYERWSAVSRQVRFARIIGHHVYDNGITETAYDNGVSVFVNYSRRTQEIDGISVPALSYIAHRR